MRKYIKPAIRVRALGCDAGILAASVETFTDRTTKAEQLAKPSTFFVDDEPEQRTTIDWEDSE